MHTCSILENDSRRAAHDSRAGTAYVDHDTGLYSNPLCMQRTLEMLASESRQVGGWEQAMDVGSAHAASNLFLEPSYGQFPVL
jgi:hypothetical protein